MSAILEQDRTSALDPVCCLGCEARRLGICRAATGPELAQLSRISRRRVFAGGDRISSPGDDGPPIGNILSGVIGITKTLPDGRQQIVGLKFASSFLGRPFAQADDTEMHAMGPVRVCVFQRSAFESLVKANGHLEHELLAQVLSDLDASRDWLLTLGRKTSLERVASYLELISAHAGQAGGGDEPGELALPLSRGEMADFLGMTIETVSRKMTELRRLGVIEFSNATSVRILSEPRLHALTGN